MEDARLRAVPVGDPVAPPDGMAFLDGIQRYAVEGYLGIAPVVRGYVSAAVLRRDRGVLRAVTWREEEFVTAPLERLPDEHRSVLAALPFPLHDCGDGERPHPLRDLQLAARRVEERRAALEAALAAERVAAAPGDWLVVDGALPGQVSGEGAARVVGLVKSHETQYLAGPDLEVALTLPAGHRTSVFARREGARPSVETWYLRLWSWEEHDVLHGLLRVERAAGVRAVEEATEVSRWLLAERAPLSAPDERWDRLLYPVRQVEDYLRARAGGWW